MIGERFLPPYLYTPHILKTTKPAGADWMVIGNSFETDGVWTDLAQLRHYYGDLGIRPADAPDSFAHVG